MTETKPVTEQTNESKKMSLDEVRDGVYQVVLDSVGQFVDENNIDRGNIFLLEGILHAMYTISGPSATATAIRRCSVRA